MTDKLEPAGGSLERAAASLRPVAAEPEAEAVPYISHARFEEDRPDFREHAVAEELGRLRAYVLRTGSREGFAPSRDFPCPGMLRVADRDAAVWLLECDACGFEVGVPKETAAPDRMVEHRLARARLPEQFVDREFVAESYHERPLLMVRLWMRDWTPESPVPGLALFGEPGRGKTHLLTIVCRDLIRAHGVDLLYRSAVDLFDELQAAFDDHSFEIKWNRLVTVPVLALDDLGAERRSEWREERLAALVDARSGANRPILLATNVLPDRWRDEFGERPASRLKGMTVRTRLEGPDRRAGMGVQAELCTA